MQKASVRGISALITGVLSAVICATPAWSQSTNSVVENPGNPTLSHSSIALIDSHARALTQPISEGTLVELKGNTRPEMTPENDRGPVADDLPMEHMLLQLKRPPELEKALQKFIDDLHDPTSPNFHKWLNAQQFGQTFGLTQQDLDTITAWLTSHGFTVNTVYPSGLLIDFSGSARQVREAFHSEIHYLQVKGVTHIANVGDPQIPAALAPAVLGVVSLHDFYPRAMHKLRGEYTISSTYQAVTPADLATIYNLTPLFESGISGQGQTITVIEDTNVYSTADWSTFRSTFGLSGYASGSFTQVHPAPPSGNDNCSDPGVNGDEGEAILDAEYASAAAPSATIELASCADTGFTFGGLIALQNLINGSTPPAIMSVSYGECEAYNGAAANAAYNSSYQQAVAEGVSVFVAAGDDGAASCDGGATSATHGIGVSGFASTPYNVAVGGTDFGDSYAGTNKTYWQSTNSPTYGSALSYIPEIPWNNSCASVLIASYLGYSITYGSSGFCNSTTAFNGGFLTTTSGSGGPSGCATGSPSVNGVVGGSCSGYAKPSWQSVLGNPNDGARDVPDISLFAANGVWGHYYVFCDSDTADGGTACTGEPSGWSGAGGTSFASPIMAGIQALVNQEVGSPQGNPNPVYYNLAAIEYGQSGNSSCNSSLGNGVDSSCIFYDVTQGDMDVNCTGDKVTRTSTDTFDCYMTSGTNGVLSTSNSAYQIAYGTATGWDFATGIGTVNAYNLVSNWPKPPTVPGAPQGVTAVAGNAQATVSFTAPTSNGGSAITGYTVTSSPAGGVDSNAGTTATTHIVTGLINGTAYTFTVTATNAVGTGAASAASNSVTPATVPGAPQGVTAVAGNAQATVSFTAPTSNGGSAITGYTVTSSPAGGVDSNAGTTATTHIVTGLINGTAYTFTVTATNAVGTGAASASSNAVTPALLPIIIVQGGTVMGTYSSIQAAYNQCASGDIIEMQAITFTESPNFNSNVTVILGGGYDSAFASQTGMTTVNGSVTISGGTITVQNLAIL